MSGGAATATALVAPGAETQDAVAEGLTAEQRRAAGTHAKNLFIEAGPGTGKTTVSAYRFAVQRFHPAARSDNRAVVAVSFTRSATWCLWRRVQRIWGPSAIAWPHRIVTLDTIMCDLLHDLLGCGLLHWPNGHTTLDVHDSWASFSGTLWTQTTYALRVRDGNVEVITGLTSSSVRVPTTVIVPRLVAGICTHGDVRRVLEQALTNPTCVDRLRTRLAMTMRALIVDEVFDANDLDIAVIELAINAGVAVTLVGDPWQALYVFRGARPEAVPALLDRTGVRTVPLTRSFRWQTDSQRDVADRLRNGMPVTLRADGPGGADPGIDVVLGLFWKPLWEIGNHVLPLAYHAFKGGTEEAAATLLLNHLTRNVFSEDATYLRDALTALAITDPDVPRQLEPELQEIAELLRIPGKAALNAAYGRLVEVVATVSPRLLRRAHRAHTSRLAALGERIVYHGRLVPGLTTHQAKGREWDAVGVHLTPSERQTLADGLTVKEDTHRKLYVACTRARSATVEV
ncbi:MAG TPA: UvrD-helicase domain-containing protein [Streptosporangiaceae bacterium]|nr:UvrD-helicase domain-containing protein [Streptosporangiaceae bacterium]